MPEPKPKTIPILQIAEELGLEGLFTKDEEKLIQSLKGRMEIFVLLRNFFLQAELTTKEKAALKEFATPQWLPLIKRMYFPELDFSRPLGQVHDLWSYMETTHRDSAEAAVEMEARQIVIDYLTQRFEFLTDGKEGVIKLRDLVPNKNKGAYQNLIDLTARSIIMKGAESGTIQLLILAKRKIVWKKKKPIWSIQ